MCLGWMVLRNPELSLQNKIMLQNVGRINQIDIRFKRKIMKSTSIHLVDGYISDI